MNIIFFCSKNDHLVISSTALWRWCQWPLPHFFMGGKLHGKGEVCILMLRVCRQVDWRSLLCQKQCCCLR